MSRSGPVVAGGRRQVGRDARTLARSPSARSEPSGRVAAGLPRGARDMCLRWSAQGHGSVSQTPAASTSGPFQVALLHREREPDAHVEPRCASIVRDGQHDGRQQARGGGGGDDCTAATIRACRTDNRLHGDSQRRQSERLFPGFVNAAPTSRDSGVARKSDKFGAGGSISKRDATRAEIPAPSVLDRVASPIPRIGRAPAVGLELPGRPVRSRPPVVSRKCP